MGVGLDTRTDADDDLLHEALGAGITRNALDFLVRVDDEACDAGVDVLLDLALRLVVTLGEDMFHRESRRLGDGELSPAGHVDVAILVGDDLVHRNATEGLGRVDDVALGVARAEIVTVARELTSDMRLVVDVERGTEVASDIAQIDAVEHHLVAVDFHAHGGDLEQVRGLHVVGQDVLACWCNGHVGLSFVTCSWGPTRQGATGRFSGHVASRRIRRGVRS